MLLTVNARCFVGVVAFTVALTGCGKDSPSAPTNTPPSTPTVTGLSIGGSADQNAHSSDATINGNGYLIERHYPGGHEPELVVEQRHRGIGQ